MRNGTKLMAAAAMAGLLAGMAGTALASSPGGDQKGSGLSSAGKSDVKQLGESGCGGKDGCKSKTPGQHDCKGKNDCKGHGGCKTGDNGCKGKNSCKGKGGCSTKPAEKPAEKPAK